MFALIHNRKAPSWERSQDGVFLLSTHSISAIPTATMRLIGQKTCYKTAITIEVSMAIAVLSFLKEDKGWTKNVFRIHVND